jgi:hypothetical protein
MRSESQSSRSSRHNKRPRAPSLWPPFRELVLLEGRRFRVSAWRLGRDAAVVVRPEGATDAEGERAIPLEQWRSFVYNALHERWERAS